MIIHTAEYVKSSATPEQCPPPDIPEFAFIGRSNVGKSSLINMLVDRSGLARISSTPGKTQTINHFIINKSWYLVDLPGYGYAKVSQKTRGKWAKQTESYLLTRENLFCLFVLIDSRIEPQKSDLEFLEMVGSRQIPVARVFTKADKTARASVNKVIKQHNSLMLEQWESLPPTFVTSTVSKEGKEDILSFIEQSINMQG